MIKSSNGKCLQISSEEVIPKSRTYLANCIQDNTPDNQKWYFQSEYDYYYIKSASNSSLALTINRDQNVSQVVVDNFIYEEKQRWMFH